MTSLINIVLIARVVVYKQWFDLHACVDKLCKEIKGNIKLLWMCTEHAKMIEQESQTCCQEITLIWSQPNFHSWVDRILPNFSNFKTVIRYHNISLYYYLSEAKTKQKTNKSHTHTLPHTQAVRCNNEPHFTLICVQPGVNLYKEDDFI